VSATGATPIEAFDPTGPLRPGRLLLEASAGTGKTHTITSLVIRLVAEQRLPIEQLLVVTFTRAATAELRDRVRGRLGEAALSLERALAHPGELPEGIDEVVEHLIRDAREVGGDELARRHRALCRAREGFDDATISTIHGFCQQALRQAGLDTDVDLDAELVEDLSDLLEEIVDDFLVRETRHADDGIVAHLRRHRVGRGDLFDLARHIEAEPDLRLHPDLADDLGYEDVWRDAVEECRSRWRAGCDEVLGWIEAHRQAGGFTGVKYGDGRARREIGTVTAWCDEPVPPLGELGDVAKSLEYLTERGMRRNLVADVPLAPPPPAVEAVRTLVDRAGRPATAARLRFARHVRDEVARRKRQRGVLSFADLLRALDEALAAPETRDALRATIRGRFAAALIDEFQDTDPVQWRVFDTVFGPDSWLYLIGDPKQAIYAFRGADVATYLRAATQVDEHATLPTNWRSDQRYLDALGALLDRPDTFGTERIGYVEVAAPNHHRDDRLVFPDGPRAALQVRHVPRVLANGEDADPTALINKGWADRHLPRLVADDVVELLSSRATLRARSGPRALAAGDVAVLTRTNRQAVLVERALRDSGVPAVVATDQSVFATHEAVALQRILDALLFSATDREARAAVTTDLIGVDGSELATLDDAAWDRWLDRLQAWAGRWREHGVAAMLRSLQAEVQAPRRLLARPRGERALTNLRHLTELLHRAETTRRLGPSGLAAWLREQRHLERPDPGDLELRLESDADAVQILTVHRAKGLQYPVVLCPWLWEGRLLHQSEERTLRFHDPADGELALDLDLARRVEPKRTHLGIAAREAWEESLRLLYVALTRAEHRCVVYTGAFVDSGPSPLGHVLHGRGFAPGPDGVPTPPSDPKDVDDATLVADLHAVATDALGVEVIERPGGRRRWERAPLPTADLDVRHFTRSLERDWRRTSFSALVRDDEVEPGSPQAEGRDLDERSEEQPQAPASSPPSDGAADLPQEAAAAELDDRRGPLADFPRGPDAGTFLHEVLERLDFTRAGEPGVLEDLVDERLARAGLAGVDRPTLRAGLRAALATPLGPLAGDLALEALPRAHRLDELSFDLPLAGGYGDEGFPLTLGRVAEVLADHAGGDAVLARAAERLRARPALGVRGFLTGSIDLVARVGERHLVVDYKSNWLGERLRGTEPDVSTVAHYHPTRLADAMVGHDYLLQALLYLVALHRFLGWRLGAAYDYERHVAGFAYLFLRGMIGPDTPRDADGTPHGVFGSRPALSLVEDLDAVLRGER
jgi:exodeoxyribonuclease V beta subunit